LLRCFGLWIAEELVMSAKKPQHFRRSVQHPNRLAPPANRDLHRRLDLAYADFDRPARRPRLCARFEARGERYRRGNDSDTAERARPKGQEPAARVRFRVVGHRGHELRRAAK